MRPGPPGSFGARLKALREAAGYTQEELATIAGLSVHGVSALERGERRRPHVETVRALGLTWGIGNAMTGMATAHLATDDLTAAEGLLDEAISVLRSFGPWFLALALDVRAILAVRRGNADESIAIVRESLTLIRGLHENHAFVFALGPLAVAAMLRGDETWAARILGARDAVTERTHATVAVRQAMDNLMELSERELRARLGPEQWAAAYAAGRMMSIDALLEEIEGVVRMGC